MGDLTIKLGIRSMVMLSVAVAVSSCADGDPDTTSICKVSRPSASSDPAITGSFGALTILAVSDERDRPENSDLTYGIVAPDGSIRAKIIWRRDKRAAGKFTVTGHRVGDSRQRITTNLNPEYASGAEFSSFVPSDLVFPSAGCWDVKAKAGGETSAYRIRVSPVEKEGQK